MPLVAIIKLIDRDYCHKDKYIFNNKISKMKYIFNIYANSMIYNDITTDTFYTDKKTPTIVIKNVIKLSFKGR